MSQSKSPITRQSGRQARRTYQTPTLVKGPKLDGITAIPVSADVCWVARAAFGESDFRWMIFRSWLLQDAPASLKRTYLRHGQRVGAWLQPHHRLRGLVRSAMLVAIRRKLARG
jgi:hypothetical protein